MVTRNCSMISSCMEHLVALHQMLLDIDSSLGLRMLVFISEIDLYFNIKFSCGDPSDL
jgi:hypothetical protein